MSILSLANFGSIFDSWSVTFLWKINHFKLKSLNIIIEMPKTIPKDPKIEKIEIYAELEVESDNVNANQWHV